MWAEEIPLCACAAGSEVRGIAGGGDRVYGAPGNLLSSSEPDSDFLYNRVSPIPDLH